MPPLRLLEKTLREKLEDGVLALLLEYAEGELAPPAWLRVFISASLVPTSRVPRRGAADEWSERERRHLREVAERWVVDQGQSISDARLTIDIIVVARVPDVLRVRPPNAWGADAPHAAFCVSTPDHPRPEILQLRGWGVVGRRQDAEDPGLGDAFDPRDPSVSRRHALLRVTGGQVAVVDLGSRNGTFVNDRRLKPDSPQRLASGDRVRCGATALELVTAR